MAGAEEAKRVVEGSVGEGETDTMWGLWAILRLQMIIQGDKKPWRVLSRGAERPDLRFKDSLWLPGGKQTKEGNGSNYLR